MSRIDETADFLPVRIAVMTVSDTRDVSNDKSGDTLAERICTSRHVVAARAIERDEPDAIEARLRNWIADPAIDVVITTGGTGITGRDVTPEAFERVLEKRIEGFGELFRMISFQKIGTSTMQSRALGGVAGGTYLFALPGSTGAVRDAWDDILVWQLDARHRPCNLVELMPPLAGASRPLRIVMALLLAAWSPALAEDAPLGPPGIAASKFVLPDRPVAPIVSDRWRDEDARERLGEAAHVIDWMGIRPGSAVADIGAGSGYYTVRLAAAVGPGGRVLAQDVVPDYVARLRARVAREKLGNVAVGMGETGDPRLPRRSVDVALLIHMYHEITQPFALTTNLVPALRQGGRIGIVDVDDATERHGTPLGLLACELAAVGYRQVALNWLLVDPPRSEYLAIFEPPLAPVPPESVRSCKD